MNRKIKILLIAIMLVAAVFLSGCVSSSSVDESNSGSDHVAENDNNTKMMSVPEDAGTNVTNEINETTSSLNTTNDTMPVYSLNATNTTSVKAIYSGSGGSSSKHSSGSSSSDDDSGSDETSSDNSDSDENDTVQITDMLGRELVLPNDVDSVIATSPPSTILVYMLAPDKVAGWNFINSFNHTLMDEKYLSLPVIGGWYGTETGNYETLNLFCLLENCFFVIVPFH